jgi:cytochrome c peroxidase
MKLRFLVASLLVLLSTLVIRASPPAPAPGPPPPPHAALCGGEPCDAVVRGLFRFLDRRLDGLDGNGRSCADCHMPTDNFQLSPANAEARFQLLRLRRHFDPNADDPLFRAVDADDFRTNGESAHDFSNLRKNGLIRVTLPLPSNIRLVDSTTGLVTSETFVDLWRMVPSVNNVALTGPDGQNPWFREPNATGGYQLDARFGSLQEQAHGAFVAHAQTQNPIPQGILDDLSSFQRLLFSNSRVRALSDAVREGAFPLPDPDPPLNALEQQGKQVFERACSICHGGPGQSTSPAGIVRMHDIATQCPRPVDGAPVARWQFTACTPDQSRNVRTYEITVAGGAKIRRASSDPGRALLPGSFIGGPPPFDDWNKHDVPGLHGIKNTAPYFLNNSAATLEDVFDHYVEVFKFIKATAPPGLPPLIASTDGLTYDRQPLPSERAAVVAYLKKQ